ncbi:MAG: hypothetical protein M3134_06045, partial [Actinomycetota bacterium]|nr:hypothetical protein [Actinomycetota bacterium]
TADRTIQDCDDDLLLEFAPGEPHGADERGGGPGPGCPPDHRGARPLRLPQTASLLHFLQLTDFQMIDEESPARVEFLDGTQRSPFFNPFAAAYRPQDSLTTQITESSVRQARNTTSPVTGATLDFTLLTGDNADSQQFNETRWFIDVLDGTTGAGNPDPEMENPPDGDRDRKIVPDSGIPVPGCEATPGTIYDGVRDTGEPGFDDGYYEPDGSGSFADGDGYSPDRVRNAAETFGRDVRLRDFPGLFERANEPFEAVGLGMPWYSAFGNHDALVQGNSPEAYFGPGGAFPPGSEVVNPAFNEIATGCVKVMQMTASQLADVLALTKDLEDGDLTPEEIAEKQGEIQRIGNEALEQAQTDPAGFLAGGGSFEIVPPDPRRCHVAKDDPSLAGDDTPCQTGSWIHQHFRTTGSPVGHGFAPSLPDDCNRYGPEEAACREAAEDMVGVDVGRPHEAVLNHDGYYSFVPKPGFRFIALDTITDECGNEFCAEGSVDEAQFDWLRRQLVAAAGEHERVIVFAHHTLRTTRWPNPDPTEQDVHYGQRFDRRGGQPQNPATTETLEELFCKNPAVIAYVSGHEHENFVEEHTCPEDTPHPTPGPGQFYEISTAAHVDFPQQSRLIDITDNCDGTLSIFGTMVDHAGPTNPGSAATADPSKLASISRELSYFEHQSGRESSRGGEEDRNLELLVKAPPTYLERPGA